MSEENQVQINFKIDPALKAELERRSKEERRSMSAHIVYLIERDIRKLNQTDQPTPSPVVPTE